MSAEKYELHRLQNFIRNSMGIRTLCLIPIFLARLTYLLWRLSFSSCAASSKSPFILWLAMLFVMLFCFFFIFIRNYTQQDKDFLKNARPPSLLDAAGD